MTVLVATSIDEVLAALAADPTSTLLAGGTDLMVELNEGHRRFGEHDSVIAVAGVPELSQWTYDATRRTLRVGATVRWRDLERQPLAGFVPALAEAARTVGSPQIRHAGTIGGNLATASPAGDGLPVLAALDAVVQLASSAGRRSLPIGDFLTGVKRTALRPGELIESVEVPLLDGWQGYAKIGVRNAMVISVAGVCVATDVPSRSVRVGLGSVAPTVVRCPEAEAWVAERIDWDGLTLTRDDAVRAGELAAAASSPIDDHRSTADYRRRAIAVMTRRLLLRAFPAAEAA